MKPLCLKKHQLKALNFIIVLILLSMHPNDCIGQCLDLVITEVGIKPLGSAKGQQSREFIELHNTTASPIDVAGYWLRTDENNNVTSPIFADVELVAWSTRRPNNLPNDLLIGPLTLNSTIIPAGGYAVILSPRAHVYTSAEAPFYDIADNTVCLTAIDFLYWGGSEVGPSPPNNWLNNEEDFVVLYDGDPSLPGSAMVDSLGWLGTEPDTGGWTIQLDDDCIFRWHSSTTSPTAAGFTVDGDGSILSSISVGSANTVVFGFCCASCSGNLVPNPSFESVTNYPSNLGQYPRVQLWNNAGGTGGASPDYFHINAMSALVDLPNCIFADVMPNTDSVIMGIGMYTPSNSVREYIDVALITPLTINQTYDISFYVTNGKSNGQYGGMGCNNIGLHFSVGALNQGGSTEFGFAPSLNYNSVFYDSTWQQINFQYTPTTAVDHITIGNFFNNAATTNATFQSASLIAFVYLFFDDFCIVPVTNSMVVSADMTICQGDSTLLTASGSLTGYTWVDSLNFTTVLSTDSMYMVSPIVTTTYAVYDAMDTLYVSVIVNQPATSIIINDTICQGDSAQLPDGSYTLVGGVFFDTLVTTSGCDSIIETSIVLDSSYSAAIASVGTVCIDNPELMLTAASGGGIWSGTGITDIDSGIFDPFTAGPGIHEIVYAISGNCGDSDTINISVFEVPSLSFLVTDESCSGKNDGSVDLTVVGGSIPYTYLWNDQGASTIEDLTTLTPGTYAVVVVDSNTCSVTGNIYVVASSELCFTPYVYIPNIFSPNADGENDNLFVQGKGIDQLIFIIYDRWGEKVFETNDQAIGWDGTYKGKTMNEAVFVYYVKATLINDEIIESQGNISLVR